MSYMLEALSGSVQASALDLSQNGIATLEFQDQHRRLYHVTTLLVGRLGDLWEWTVLNHQHSPEFPDRHPKQNLISQQPPKTPTQPEELKARGVAGPMGRPSFRGVVLRDHGTERRERLPTMGTAPKTQVQALCKNTRIRTPKGLFRHLAHPIVRKQSGTTGQTGHSSHHTIQYRKQGAHQRRHPPNTETRKGWFPGPPRGGGRTPAPSSGQSCALLKQNLEGN